MILMFFRADKKGEHQEEYVLMEKARAEELSSLHFPA
jgi:hypothetical protein